VRILGLDIGSKRIGAAVSDELGFTAQGLETITRRDLASDVERIAHITSEYGVREIVVGLPYNMDGSEGPQVESVRLFVEHIRRRIDIPVTEWDERLTTVAAERVLLEADMSRAKRRKVVDKLAAVLILQGYLDGRGAREFVGE
jgi:putative holliday junction resolvase